MDKKDPCRSPACSDGACACLWSDSDNFCDVLQKAGVPLNGHWPAMIVYLRSLHDNAYLTEVQKSAMQELLLSVLQSKDFSESSYKKTCEAVHKIHQAPYEQKLREIMREAAALASEVNKILGRHRDDVISVAETMDANLARGTEPTDVLADLRNALRGVVAKMEEDTEHLSRLSQKDSLTGLANRRSFDAFLDESIALWLKDETPTALLMLDIDLFKTFNDNFGHLVGDQVLRTVAGRIDRQVAALQKNGADMLAVRYGGEEFAVLIRGDMAAKAAEFAEHLRKVVADTTLLLRDASDNVLTQGLRLTVSIGVAALWSGWFGTYQTNLVDCADKALYHGKRDGRNCTYQYTPDGNQAYTRVTPKG